MQASVDEPRVCSLPGCDARLRSSNSIGYCRPHRQHAPIVVNYRAAYRLAKGKERNAAVRAKRVADPEGVRAAARAQRAANPESVWRANRNQHLKTNHGITLSDYDAMLERQGGGCAICGDTPPPGRSFHVDHNHETDRLRELLCERCNPGLGSFRDDPELLRAAADYLDRHMG